MEKLNDTPTAPLRFVTEGCTIGQFYNSRDKRYHLAAYVQYKKPPEVFLCGRKGNFSSSRFEGGLQGGSGCADCLKELEALSKLDSVAFEGLVGLREASEMGQATNEKSSCEQRQAQAPCGKDYRTADGCTLELISHHQEAVYFDPPNSDEAFAIADVGTVRALAAHLLAWADWKAGLASVEC